LVLILEPGLEGWVEVPPFTSDMIRSVARAGRSLHHIS
jgi:hypothetical protein